MRDTKKIAADGINKLKDRIRFLRKFIQMHEFRERVGEPKHRRFFRYISHYMFCNMFLSAKLAEVQRELDEKQDLLIRILRSECSIAVPSDIPMAVMHSDDEAPEMVERTTYDFYTHKKSK